MRRPEPVPPEHTATPRAAAPQAWPSPWSWAAAWPRALVCTGRGLAATGLHSARLAAGGRTPRVRYAPECPAASTHSAPTPAAGACIVFCIKLATPKLLASSLGFAAGVML